MRLLGLSVAATCVCFTSHALPTASEWRLQSEQELERQQRQTIPNVELVVGDDESRHSIHVRLRPEFSPESAEFMSGAARATCPGELYRNEPGFLVQGRFKCGSQRGPPNVARKGPCPSGVTLDPGRKCFAHDPDCGCHGPIMTKGMVGWAGGGKSSSQGGRCALTALSPLSPTPPLLVLSQSQRHGSGFFHLHGKRRRSALVARPHRHWRGCA